jgi:hypothetical protein
MQACTLSREWIVSLLILAKGDPESWLEENTARPQSVHSPVE